MKRLLDYCSVSGKNVTPFDGIKKYVATGDVINNRITSYENVDYKNKPSRANQIADSNEVLFAKMKDTKKVLLINEKTAENIYSTGFFVIKANSDVLPEYLYWLFNSKNFNQDKDKNSKGATQKAINLDGLGKIMIKEIPSLDKQKEIISKISNCNEIIELKKEQLDELDNLSKSQFVEMFGDVTKNDKKWNCIKLDEVATIKSGGTPSRNHPEYFNGNIPWITTVALGKNIIDENDAVEYITEEAINNSATKLIDKNSLLFGIRVGVGKVSVNKVPMCTNQDIVAITDIDSKIRILFLKKVLDAYAGFFNSQKRGATIQGITSGMLKEIEIPIVNTDVQDEFIKFLEHIDKLEFVTHRNAHQLCKMI